MNVNVTPTSHDLASDTPEIRKYKKRFNSEILCAALWGEYSCHEISAQTDLDIHSSGLFICRSQSVNWHRKRLDVVRPERPG